SRAPVLELRVMSETERYQVIEAFNATKASYPKDKLIQELFEAQVDRAPSAVAVEFEGQSLTYRDLNSRANRLASYMRKKGVVVGEYIPVLMRRSLEMLVAQLAIVK